MSDWLPDVLGVLLWLLPGGLWCAWWLCCVNWKNAWPVLANGGWAVVVLLVLVSALAWAGIFPAAGRRFLGLPLPNFLYQLVACTSLALVALFCGWLQERLGWTPEPVNFDPPAEEHGHDHHGHHAHH